MLTFVIFVHAFWAGYVTATLLIKVYGDQSGPFSFGVILLVISLLIASAAIFAQEQK